MSEELGAADLARAAARAEQAHRRRDEMIVRAAAEGWSNRSISRATRLSHTAVAHILRRDRPAI